MVAPSGEARWIALRGEVERDQGGMALRMRSASQDITSRKEAEMQLHSLSGKLVVTQEEERRRVARELHDGAGFDPQAARSGGLGLGSMEERVRYARGRFQLTSRSGAGTKVRVWVPIDTAAAEEPSDEEAGSAG